MKQTTFNFMTLSTKNQKPIKAQWQSIKERYKRIFPMVFVMFLTGAGGVITWPPTNEHPEINATFVQMTGISNGLYGSIAIMSCSLITLALWSSPIKMIRLGGCLLGIWCCVIMASSFWFAGDGPWAFTWIAVMMFGVHAALGE